MKPKIMVMREFIELQLAGEQLLEKLDRLCVICWWCHDRPATDDYWKPVKLSCVAAWFHRLKGESND